jgi:hypothetical protein
MPLKLKRVSSPPVSISGNSVLFNGSNQYLSLANNAAFNLSGAFTVECWIYFTSTPTLNASSVPGVTMARYGITGNTNQGWDQYQLQKPVVEMGLVQTVLHFH